MKRYLIFLALLAVAACDSGTGGGGTTGGDAAQAGDTASGTDAATGSDATPDSDATPGTDATTGTDASSGDVPSTQDVPQVGDVADTVSDATAETTSTACKTNTAQTCPSGQVCQLPEGQCSATGQCVDKPASCTKELLPVCGCNGQTYDNACLALQAGTGVIHIGPCSSAGCAIGQAGSCPVGQFCAANEGVCSGTGTCLVKPVGCTEEWAPVCGCDGKTYGNKCNASSAGVVVAKQGECKPTPTGCKIGGSGECGADEYCQGPEGVCSGLGQCAAKPMNCTKEQLPVCGCDGNTYGNKCAAAASGATVAYPGECKPNPGGCKVGGQGECAAGQFCQGQVGQCSGFGQCVEQPAGGCTKEYNPQCGCDGQTYGNPCMAAAAGVTVFSAGACGPAPGGCKVGGVDCGPDQYCAVPMGQCSGEGQCAMKPGACILLYDPVCGCDDKTYGNGCGAASNGMNVAYKGECKGPPPGGCKVGDANACPADEFCKLDGQCGGEGTCTKKPQICLANYAPVCGCDGQTYSNACEANGAGQNFATKGECPVTPLQWFWTCGPPVCMGYKPQNEIPPCTDQKPGAACSTPGGMCDPKDDCQRYFVCTDKDPTAAGCPKSRAALKTDVKYLTPADQAALADRLLQTRLATYKYTAQGAQAPRHLGFIIDDDPGSPAVDARRDMVDLYGYLSMAVATLQAQQRKIDELEAQIRALKADSAVGMCRMK